jgi:hypothetical protein
LTGFHGQKYAEIAELKLSSCGLEVADFRKNCDCGVAVAEQHFFKSCGIAIVEALPSSCGISIADSKKKLRLPTSVSWLVSTLVIFQVKSELNCRR